jgi:hypothetical protein
MATNVSMDLPVRLYGLDRSSVRAYVLQALKSDPTFGPVFNNFVSAGQGMLFVEVVVNATIHALYYGDRRAKNAYLPTSDMRSAVAGACETLGYKMRGAVAGTVDLDTVTLPSGPYAFDVPIPRGFKFTGDGKVFESLQAVTIPAGATSLVGVISLSQGETKVRTFTGTGVANQRLVLGDVSDAAGKFVANDSVRVWVDGLEWDVVDFISFDDTATEVQVNYNATYPEIQGGDGVAGEVFPDGATVKVSYFVTDGVAGSVAKERINAEVSPLVVMGQTIPLTVLNSTKVVGAYDRETLAEASTTAPRWKRTGNVGVSRDDMEALAETFSDGQYGTVSKAKALSARSASSDHAFIGMLSDLENSVSAPSSAITSEVAVLNGLIADATALVDSIRSTLTDLGTTRSDIVTQTSGIVAQRAVIDPALDMLSTYLSSLASHISTITVGVTAIKTDSALALGMMGTTITSGGVLTELEPTVYNQLLAYIISLNTNGSDVEAKHGALSTDRTNISAVGTALSGATSALTTITNALVGDTSDILAQGISMMADVTALSNVGATSGKLVDTTASVLVVENENVGWQDAAMELSADLYDYLDSILAHDCKANVISLPILTLDSDGFYAAPSIGLVARLEEWMNAGRVSPAVYVSVASGEDFLVEADITITGVVLPGNLVATVESDLADVVDGVLKGRAFGATLYEKEFYDAIRDASVPGVGTALTVKIVGDPAYLDTNGNLAIDSTHVVTKGTITFNLTATV